MDKKEKLQFIKRKRPNETERLALMQKIDLKTNFDKLMQREY